MASILFEISWAPAGAATLRSLLDNGDEVLAVPVSDLGGRIAVQWDADGLVRHAIRWDLSFPAIAMSRLRAVAAWDGRPLAVLAEARRQVHGWCGEHVVPARAA